jgi:hypothetical protein
MIPAKAIAFERSHNSQKSIPPTKNEMNTQLARIIESIEISEPEYASALKYNTSAEISVTVMRGMLHRQTKDVS